MSDETKCKLCMINPMIGINESRLCKRCYPEVTKETYNYVISKLILRIEKLEGMLGNWESIIQSDRKEFYERIIKLEQKESK